MFDCTTSGAGRFKAPRGALKLCWYEPMGERRNHAGQMSETLGLSVNISSRLPEANVRFFLPEPRQYFFVAFVSCQTARTFVTAVKKGIKQQVSHGFRCEECSAAFCVNNEELFWQPVAVPLKGLVRGHHRNGQFELSWDGAFLSVPCGEVGRRFALASEKSFVALPCW